MSRLTGLLTSLGFIINPEKSVLTPSKTIEFLAFILNSNEMSVKLTEAKAVKMIGICQNILKQKKLTIREVAQLIGKMVSTFPGNPYGPLYYRNLENGKIDALKCNKGDYDAFMELSCEAKQDIKWWVDNLKSVFKPINVIEPELNIRTDASLSGWGAFVSCRNTTAGGRWTAFEANHHINYFGTFSCVSCFTIFLQNDAKYTCPC